MNKVAFVQPPAVSKAHVSLFDSIQMNQVQLNFFNLLYSSFLEVEK